MTESTSHAALSSDSPVLILGCGYSGQAIARRLTTAGHAVTGTTTREARFAAIAASGATPALLNLREDSHHTDLIGLLRCHRAVVIAIGPLRTEGEDFIDLTPQIVATLQSVQWRGPIVYLSSTGIYGNQQGGWVDEETPPAHPLGPRGELRLTVETALFAAHRQWHAKVRILRLAGIYGPGRHLGLRLKGGNYRVVEATPELVVNRIHVDDLAQTVFRALHYGKDGTAYVVADGHPAGLRQVADYTAALMGLPSPPGEPFEAARARMGEANIHLIADRKQCDNRRLREELGVTLGYPTYREGLLQALTADGLLASD